MKYNLIEINLIEINLIARRVVSYSFNMLIY